MKLLRYITPAVAAIMMLSACDDNDSFTSNPLYGLKFERDTICLDTVFANTLSAYKMIKVRNNSGDGLRLTSITQKQGAEKSGFMVNVNGSYIDPLQNNTLRDMEIRNGDTIRIFTEFKPQALSATTEMKEVEDEVVFNFESGRTQTLYLKAWAWNADRLSNYHVRQGHDTTLVAGRPLVVYGMLTVDSAAHLTIDKGTTIYFHQDAGIDVYGNLAIKGEKGSEVTLRCDRLDSLLQLKYDNVPGKWKGIRLRPSSGSERNDIDFMDLHGSEYGIVADTSLLDMRHSTVHNISGAGVQLTSTIATIENCQLSNARDYCLNVMGGDVLVNSSTLASFYAYSTGRLNALHITDKDEKEQLRPLTFFLTNSIVTGYEDDELWYTPWKSDSIAQGVKIDHCLLRTVKPTGKDSVMLTNCNYENLEDTINGEKMFRTFDTYHFAYDFTPKENSSAIGMADPVTSAADDRRGETRKAKPDAGCYETFYEEKK